MGMLKRYTLIKGQPNKLKCSIKCPIIAAKKEPFENGPKLATRIAQIAK